RLWNPKTQKGLLALLRRGPAVKLVDELLREAEKFFGEVEDACDELRRRQQSARKGPDEDANVPAKRSWTELRIREPDLVADNVTLPIQRLREAVGELIKLAGDQDTGQE